jgi:phospholipase D1/2
LLQRDNEPIGLEPDRRSRRSRGMALELQARGEASELAQAADRPPRRRASAGRASGAILQPGRNVWRIERAQRAAALIDAAPFFRAVREALRKARHSVFIVGWDIDSRMRLVGEDCEPDDGMPITFVDFLSALVRERPELTVHLLLWDYSMLYALERELFPTVALHWATPRQVRVCLDDELPLGSSHHQKIIVVDDAVAFSGGLDLTIRRWDTPDHRLDNPDRVDPMGNPYRPFHDVQALVDGPAARALAELARARWTCASGDPPTEIEPAGDPWPDSVAPDLCNVPVGIARTLPFYEDEDEVREVEALFCDSIAATERTLYIENQFVTSPMIAEQLARTMRERPELETVIVAPQHYDSWIENRTMRNGRIRFVRTLQQAGIAERVRLLYPHVTDGARTTSTMIHSKVFVVDDRLLRIGSANLNNRSMGTDTECDLAFEAETAAHRQAITEIRNRLLGEHCGTDGEEIAAALRGSGSLIKVAEQVSHNGHALRPVDDGEPDAHDISAAIEEVADPPRPPATEIAGATRFGHRLSKLRLSSVVKIAVAALLIIALPLAWKYTPLAALADPAMVQRALVRAASGPWAPVLVVGVFVLGGLVAFPVLILIAVTAATFGPVLGLTYAASGCLASALVTYFIGARLGKELLRDYLGPRLDRIRRHIVRQGVISVAAIRVVPIAPFTFVNLVAGASQIRLQDYVLGTILGMAPGLVIMSALGYQIFELWHHPTWTNIGLLVAAVIGWLGVSLGVQILVSKRRRAES